MNDKVVYLHRRKLDNKVFYVGMGYKKRAYDFISRNKFWHNYVKKYGEPLVDIYRGNLTTQGACKIEVNLIKKYGRRSRGEGHLVNLSSGGEMGTIGVNEKRVICLKKGVIYKSITDYCETYNYSHSTISHFLNFEKYNNYKTDYLIRFVIDNKIQWIPYFDGNFSRKDNTDQLCVNTNYNVNNNDIVKQSIKEKLSKISDLDLALLYLCSESSIAFVSKKFNIPYHVIYNKINNLKKKFIDNKYPNTYNKHLPLKIEQLIIDEYYNFKKINYDFR